MRVCGMESRDADLGKSVQLMTTCASEPVSSTSPSGGNQVDGLPPASSIFTKRQVQEMAKSQFPAAFKISKFGLFPDPDLWLRILTWDLNDLSEVTRRAYSCFSNKLFRVIRGQRWASLNFSRNRSVEDFWVDGWLVLQNLNIRIQWALKNIKHRCVRSIST